MPAAQQQSYNVDDDGKFSRGSLQVDDKGAKFDDTDLGELACEFNLDELRTLERLGEGASGVVFKAQNTRTGQVMAVKTFSVFDRNNRHQFIKELKALYGAKCPSLIQFYGAFFKDGHISICIELMDCGDLHAVLKKAGRFPEDVLACFARQTLSGLAYLAGKHQIHRDIKPGNICVNSAGEAKLTDFGISSQLDGTMGAANTFVGTSAYMAPERIMGKQYSYPSDIWSLGVSLLFCCHGRNPYDSADLFEVRHLVCQRPAPKLDPTKWSPELCEFVQLMLIKDPSQRATAAQLLRHPWLMDAEDTSHYPEWNVRIKASELKMVLEPVVKRFYGAEPPPTNPTPTSARELVDAFSSPTRGATATRTCNESEAFHTHAKRAPLQSSAPRTGRGTRLSRTGPFGGRGRGTGSASCAWQRRLAMASWRSRTSCKQRSMP